MIVIMFRNLLKLLTFATERLTLVVAVEFVKTTMPKFIFSDRSLFRFFSRAIFCRIIFNACFLRVCRNKQQHYCCHYWSCTFERLSYLFWNAPFPPTRFPAFIDLFTFSNEILKKTKEIMSTCWCCMVLASFFEREPSIKRKVLFHDDRYPGLRPWNPNRALASSLGGLILWVSDRWRGWFPLFV